MRKMKTLIYCTILLRLFAEANDQLDPLEAFLQKFLAFVIPNNENNATFQMYQWKKYMRFESDPNFAIDDMPGYCQKLPESEIPRPHEMGLIGKAFTEVAYSEMGYSKRLKHLDQYTAFFSKYIPLPEYLIKHWKEDEEFSRQFIQGVHPLMIKFCQNKSEIPNDMLHLTVQNKTVSELIQEKRLFIVDYNYLEDIPVRLRFQFYSPTVLLYKHLSESPAAKTKSKLMVLGIRLTRKKKDNVIYTPKSPPNRYLFAKIHVNHADSQVHHLISHLGFTHLTMEVFAIAFNNHLRRNNHVLSPFLEPHFYKTIYQGLVARNTVIASTNPISDHILSIGAVGSIKLFIRMLKKSKFMDRSFPNNLNARGFTESREDELEGYFYRDDGFKLWNAIKNYVEKYVSRIYNSDEAVAHDKVLQDFASSISDPAQGNIPSFPHPIDSKQLLIDCLTTILFTVTGQHSVVNFPQEPYNSFVPNRPQTLTARMPEGEDDIDMEFILNALPDAMVAKAQFDTAHLFTIPSPYSLTKLNNIKHIYPDIHESFQAELQQISQEISNRNKLLVEEGKIPYFYLDPQFIPASIDT